MGKASIKENKNIYQLTREKLGLSRAAAVKNIPGNPEFPGMDGIAEYRLVKIEDGSYDDTILAALNLCEKEL